MTDTLVDRLNTGWAMCESEADPVKRARLEAHWVGLLREYEAAVNAGMFVNEEAA